MSLGNYVRLLLFALAMNCSTTLIAAPTDSPTTKKALALAVSKAQQKKETTAPLTAELRTSGSVAAVKFSGSLKPVYPKAAHTYFPKIKKFPRVWRSTPGDPLGEYGWFSVAWTVTDRLPQTEKEWTLWSEDVARRRIARLQAISDRRGQLADLSYESTVQIARMLYLTSLASLDKSLFDDPLIPVLRKAALREQLKMELDDLEPAMQRYDEARFELAKHTDSSQKNCRVTLDEVFLPAPSQWEIIRLFDKIVNKQRVIDVKELLQAEKEIARLETAMNPQFAGGRLLGMLTPGETEIPPPYVPYTTMLPIDDAQLPSTSVNMPSMKAPKPLWVEVVAKSDKDKVVALVNGEVVYASHLEGAGVVVVVAHTDDLYSIYSNLSQAVVSVGQKIAKGDVLGVPGAVSNGNPGVRFAARKKDVPTTVTVFKEYDDPQKLLQKN